jgi:acylphosphatase
VLIRRRVLVSGRVQGVFFRDTVSGEARARGVAGSVANLDDGRLEAVFEGEEDDVEALIELSHHGPERAKVESVEVIEEEPEDVEGFRVS